MIMIIYCHAKWHPTLPGCKKEDMLIYCMPTLNGISPFEIKPILKLYRLCPKRTISYHLKRSITYGIKFETQPEMGECAQAHKVARKDVVLLEGVIYTQNLKQNKHQNRKSLKNARH
jgi:hypothetical protein